MTESYDHRVLVAGISTPAGRSAAGYFKEKGYFVIGAGRKEGDVQVDAFHKLPSVNSPDFENSLFAIIETERPSLFIPTRSEELSSVARFRAELNAHGCTVFVAPVEAVDIASDTLVTARYLEGCGIRVPKTFEQDRSRYEILKEISLPIVARPISNRGGKGVKLLRSVEEILGESRSGIVFQEFISGEEFEVHLFLNGGVFDPAAGVVLMVDPMSTDDGGAIVERAEREDIKAIAVEAANALRLRGPAVVDIRLDELGEPVVVGVKARVGENVGGAGEVLDAVIEKWEDERGSLQTEFKEAL